jgi:hypothetical protein
MAIVFGRDAMYVFINWFFDVVAGDVEAVLFFSLIIGTVGGSIFFVMAVFCFVVIFDIAGEDVPVISVVVGDKGTESGEVINDTDCLEVDAFLSMITGDCFGTGLC